MAARLVRRRAPGERPVQPGQQRIGQLERLGDLGTLRTGAGLVAQVLIVFPPGPATVKANSRPGSLAITVQVVQ